LCNGSRKIERDSDDLNNAIDGIINGKARQNHPVG
jgi:hypothetical protein